jgi:hypothetical protein
MMFYFQSGQLGHATKSETRPGEFVIFMLSITIEKEDFEVNCLYKTRWDSYPGIGKGKKIIFIKKNLPNF